MKKSLKMKSTKFANTDSEERFPFSVWSNLTKREIERVYIWRRKSLLEGHCIRCAKELPRDMYCKTCDTNMIEFCFEEDLKKRDLKIQETIKKIKFRM